MARREAKDWFLPCRDRPTCSESAIVPWRIVRWVSSGSADSNEGGGEAEEDEADGGCDDELSAGGEGGVDGSDGGGAGGGGGGSDDSAIVPDRLLVGLRTNSLAHVEGSSRFHVRRGSSLPSAFASE